MRDMLEIFAAKSNQTIIFLAAVLLTLFLGFSAITLILRQFFASGSVILHDLVAYSFALLILISIVVAQIANRHVRVETLDFYWQPRTLRRINWFAYWIFLVPGFMLIFFKSLPGLILSWHLLEGSSETNGLGGYFLIKSFLPIVCLAMILLGYSGSDRSQTGKTESHS